MLDLAVKMGLIAKPIYQNMHVKIISKVTYNKHGLVVQWLGILFCCKKVMGSILAPFWVEFACFPHVCIGFPQYSSEKNSEISLETFQIK